MITQYVRNSIIKFFKDNIPNLYVYDDSIIDISKQTECSAKIDLPLGAETTFILVNNEFAVDFTGQDIKNWHIRITHNGTDVFKRIADYNPTTGQVTLESAFGFAVTTSDLLTVTCLDSLFITSYNVGSMGGYKGRKNAMYDNERISITLQTKYDSSKIKIREFMDNIKSAFYSNFKKIPMYDLSSNLLTYLNVVDFISFAQKVDSDQNLQSFVGTFMVEYKIKY